MVLKFNDFKLLKESIDNEYVLSATDIEWAEEKVSKLITKSNIPPIKQSKNTNFDEILKKQVVGAIPAKTNIYLKAILDYVEDNELPASAINTLTDYIIYLLDKYVLTQKDKTFINNLVKELCDSGYKTNPDISYMKPTRSVKNNPDKNVLYQYYVDWYIDDKPIPNRYCKNILKYIYEKELPPKALTPLIDYAISCWGKYTGNKVDVYNDDNKEPEHFKVVQNIHRPTGSDYFVYKNATFVKWNRQLDKPDYKSESVKLIAGDKVYNDIIGEIYDDADDAIDSINSELEGTSLHFQTKLNRRKQGTTFNNPIFTDILFLKQLIKFLYENNDIRLTKNLLKDKFSSLKDIEIESLLHNQSNMGIIEYDAYAKNYIIHIEDEQEYQRILDVIERYRDTSYSGT